MWKCAFLKEEIEYLGYEIHGERIKPGKRKIQTVWKFDVPCNAILGLYFRKFVKGFLEIAKPFTDLAQMNISWRWGDREPELFEKVKTGLGERPNWEICSSILKTEL